MTFEFKIRSYKLRKESSVEAEVPDELNIFNSFMST
jgi:hypothetical protein